MMSVEINEMLVSRTRLALEPEGLSVEDAVRLLFAHLAVHGALPDCLKSPNLDTRAAMAEADDLLARRLTASPPR